MSELRSPARGATIALRSEVEKENREMRTLWLAPVALGVGLLGCAEVEAPTTENAEPATAEQREGVYSMSKDLVNANGSTITVTVVAGTGAITPETVAGVLDGITAVEVNPAQPVDGTSPTFDGFVTDEEPLWIPSEIPGLFLRATPDEPEAYYQDDLWYLIEGIDENDIRQFEDNCPPWH